MSNPIEKSSQSFTLEATGILRELKTPCGICKAYDPNTGGAHPKIEQLIGLWDTGATCSVISKQFAEKIGLVPFKKGKVFHADGEAIVNVYAINIFLPNHVAFSFVTVTEGKLNGFDMLIGMDIISKGDFVLSNHDGKTSFSFRVPSMEKIEFQNPKPPVKAARPRTAGSNFTPPKKKRKK